MTTLGFVPFMLHTLGRCVKQWLEDHLPEIEQTHASPVEVRDAFWEKWELARKANAPMAADCLWSVEARFLHQCVADHPDERTWS